MDKFVTDQYEATFPNWENHRKPLKVNRILDVWIGTRSAQLQIVNRKPKHMRKNGMEFDTPDQSGFSLVEIVLVLAISITLLAIAVPRYAAIVASMRVAGDLRSITGVTAQAKMRAAADFTRARVYADLNGGGFQLQIWNKAGGCWVAEADTSNTCLTYTSGTPSGTVTSLAQGDTFGYGTLTAGPTPGQTTIGQAANCLDNSGTAITNTACIVFNSRGIPIDGSTLAPIATGALYLTNGTVVDGLTISATGSIQTWSQSASGSSWIGQ
jgi:type II secretory pathway pseudopilin PulG